MRTRVWDTPEGLLLVIPARTRWFAVGFLLVWLGGWSLGEVAAIRALLAGAAHGPAGLFTGFWLVGWSCGGALAGYSLLWYLVGQERILLAHDALVLRKVVLGLGPEKRFDLTRVTDLRVDAGSGEPDRRGGLQLPTAGGSGLVAFDYDARTVRFGLDLDEPEGAWIVSQLAARHGFPGGRR